MGFILRITRTQLLMVCLLSISIAACGIAKGTPQRQVVLVTQVVPITKIVQATQMVEVTRIVPVTQIVESPPNEVTRIVLAAPIIEVTRLVVVEMPPTQAPGDAQPTPVLQTPPPIPAAVSTPVNTQILVWYDFEGDFLTSGMIADRSGNGYDAQINGSVYESDGISGGQAILLDGGGYIQAQINPVATMTNISFSIWFRTDHPENNYKIASAAWWNGGPVPAG